LSLAATVAAVIALGAGAPGCEPGAANCAAAGGRIVLVQAVDPDGDGDAHFVLAGSGDVTAPGISVIDVERELRPDPLPGLGDYVAAAGPVYEGSFGQRQIQATELRFARVPSRR
jgi:hypothetical protein